MTKTEKEVFDKFIRRLNKVKKVQKIKNNQIVDYQDTQLEILIELGSELPSGKINKFFQEVEEKINLVEKMVPEDIDEEPSNEEAEKILNLLREARAKFQEEKFPQDVPRKIIEIYKDCLDYTISSAEAMKDATEIFKASH